MIESVALQFSGLSRLAQAVFGYVTIASIQQPDGTAKIAWVIRDLGVTQEEWGEAFDELSARQAVWLVGEDRVQTEATHPLCMSSHASPVNRPKRKDWEALRVRAFEYHFDRYEIEPHCVYCGAEGVTLELDHMIPLARGGSNHLLNLIPACMPCNRSKGSRTPREWRGAK